MDPAFDLSENGRKLAHATFSVCSKPTGELGSCYECKKSLVGSRTKGIHGALRETRKTSLNQALERKKSAKLFQMTVNSLLHIFKTNLEHKKKKTNQSSSYKLSFKDISAMAREFV